MKKFLCTIFISSLFFSAYAQEKDMDELFDLSLEELLDQAVVTSVSKNEEKLQDVASAITVLSSRDIKNSGATNLHELLRRVPGYWGVSSDYNSVGSAIRLSTFDEGRVGSILFLLDGTPVQDYMFANFSYEIFDIPIEDIERVEIIKGSGGSIYGANAATGVISIYTREPDKYNDITLRAEMADPTFQAVSVTGGKSLGSLSIAGFGKFRHFDGYALPAIYQGEEISVPSINDPAQMVTIDNRFTEDFSQSDMFTIGLKANYQISDKSSLSFRSHFNQLHQLMYTNLYLPETFYQEDRVYLTDTRQSRIAGNINFTHQFSETHHFSARVSNSSEVNFQDLGGGFYSRNYMNNIEIQDNFVLGKHAINLGFEYRIIDFNIDEMKSPAQFNYLELATTEIITGAFIQDKITLFEDKLRLILGLKAENYSLINDKYYFSPNLKFSYSVNQKISIWGGYNLSYSTIGFNQANLDYKIFRAPTYPFFYQESLQPVTDGAYQQAYQQAIAAGYTQSEAEMAASAYVQSSEGQGAINYITDSIADGFEQLYPGYYNVEVNNGSNVEPIKFQNFELGLRAVPAEWMTFETNLFYTLIDDAVKAAPVSTIYYPENTSQPSLTTAGQRVDKLYYGNYIRGNSKGIETIIRFKPSKKIEMEISHTYLNTHLEYKENDDFDISQWDEESLVLGNEAPGVPENVFRFAGYFTLPMNIQFSVDALYGTQFQSQALFQQNRQRFSSVLESSNGIGNIIAANDDRTIVNFKIQKDIIEDRFSIYAFGNDIFTSSRIENADYLVNTTYSAVGRMVGAGINYRIGL